MRVYRAMSQDWAERHGKVRDAARCWKNILGARDDGLRMSSVSLRNK